MYETLITLPVRSGTITTEQEPVTPTEARKQCELGDITHHDQQLQRIITAAREQVEADTGLVCYTSTFTLKMTEWPTCGYFKLWGARPVSSVTSITYVDTDGTTTTWGSSNYVLETGFVVPIVRLAYNVNWPSVRGDINGITVTFVAGYASVAVIPQTVKEAVLSALLLQWKRDTATPNDVNLYERLVARLGRATYP